MLFRSIKAKTLEILAGTENVHRFQDGNDPLFCLPRKMKYYKGNLYILDFNVIRKISLGNQGELSTCRVVAGKATGALNPKMSRGAGEELLLSTINPIDFCMSEEGLLLTDPTQFKIMKIK